MRWTKTRTLTPKMSGQLQGQKAKADAQGGQAKKQKDGGRRPPA